MADDLVSQELQGREWVALGVENLHGQETCAVSLPSAEALQEAQCSDRIKAATVQGRDVARWTTLHHNELAIGSLGQQDAEQ